MAVAESSVTPSSVYIATMTGEVSEERFPEIRGLPRDMRCFVVVSEAGDLCSSPIPTLRPSGR